MRTKLQGAVIPHLEEFLTADAKECLCFVDGLPGAVRSHEYQLYWVHDKDCIWAVKQSQ